VCSHVGTILFYIDANYRVKNCTEVLYKLLKPGISNGTHHLTQQDHTSDNNDKIAGSCLAALSKNEVASWSVVGIILRLRLLAILQPLEAGVLLLASISDGSDSISQSLL